MKLKSGTDIRGVAVETENSPVDLTDEVVYSIASAFVLWLGRKTGKAASELSIGLGHDCRISSPRIAEAVRRAVVGAGAKLVFSGLASTPEMFMMTLGLNLDASVQITASHHPFDRNGLKFFLPTGGLEGENIKEILTLCQNGEFAPETGGGCYEEYDYMPEYTERLRKLIIESVGAGEKPLEGQKIVVDAGNGVGGFYARKVLEPLGADISGSIYLEPDGMFPNHAPNPENPAAMKAVADAVKSSGAALGIVFDTDVDRAGAVDSEGNEINRNRLIALASALVLEEHPGGAIVTDSTTSAGLAEFITSLGGKHYRYKRGYKNVIGLSIELCEKGIDSPLAIETSGHAALSENYFLDDGAYLMTKFVIAMAKMSAKGKTLSGLIENLREPKEEKEIRIKIAAEDFAAYGKSVLAHVEECCSGGEWIPAPDNASSEGFRATLPEAEGWFIIRLSVHDPVLPVNIESDREGGVEMIFERIKGMLEGFDKLVF